jgi:Asp-tRNA(Asn)/Glu-tRNA(Gln) amidotransferase A subunit family amidase
MSAPSLAHPLSGLRFGVKDVFDIKGLKTSAGSKVYHQFYPKWDETAPVIAHLVKLGAVIVGKTKNTQFANEEDPQEWIDYSCPWNSRGMLP